MNNNGKVNGSEAEIKSDKDTGNPLVSKELKVKEGGKGIKGGYNQPKTGKFLVGNKGRPKGIKNRDRGDGYTAGDLMSAIDMVERAMQKSGHTGFNLLVHFIERSVKSDKMAVSILKKILPDLTQVTGDTSKNIIIVQTSSSGEEGLKEAEQVIKHHISVIPDNGEGGCH